MKRLKLVLSYSSILLVPLLSGCAMFENWGPGGTSAGGYQPSEYAYLDERIRLLTERITYLEQTNANLQRDLADVQLRLSQVQAGAGGQASATEIQQLRAQIQALEIQRERDKQLILDQVSKEIAGLAARRSASGGGGGEVGYEHTVKQGQTLSDIARAYGVSVTAIKKANNLSNDLIRVGQVLFIPKPQ